MMKRHAIVLSLILAILFGIVGCTQQQIAKNFGGTAQIELPPGQKLVTATWKEQNLWYLIRPMRTGEQPETSELIESSSFGVVQGKVIFIEKSK